jgi:hypothetical protein
MIDELPDETFRLLVSEGKLLEFLPLEPRQQELFGKDKEENLRQVVLPMTKIMNSHFQALTFCQSISIPY